MSTILEHGNLQRRIKNSLLKNIPLTGIDKEIVDFINSKLNDLTPVKLSFDNLDILKPIYKSGRFSSLFYVNSIGECVIEHTQYNDFLIRDYGLWDVLENKYSMEYDKIQYLLTYMLKHKFNIDVTSVHWSFTTTK